MLSYLAIGVLSFIPLIQFLSPVILLFIIVLGGLKAYNGERYKFPIFGDIAEDQASNLPS